MENNLPILIFLILIVVCITYFVKKNRDYNTVEQLSEKIKKIKEINNLYYFDNFFKIKREINHYVNSLAKLRRIDYDVILMDYIENDIDNIQSDIKTAIENKKRYDSYILDCDTVDLKTDCSVIQQSKIKEDKFYSIEKKIVKKITISNVYNISIIILVNYTSPKGRNSYNKTFDLKYYDIIDCYKNWQNIKIYKNSKRYERFKMSDSIRYDVLKRDNYKCCICGMSAKDGIKLHVDHIIPISKGGKTEMNNLQTLCERCNFGKSNKL